MTLNNLVIVVPCYNEQDNIEQLIHDYTDIVNKTGALLLLIDDGSKDSTVKKIESLKHLCNIELVKKTNSGHGSTIRFGYDYAIKHGYDYIFQIDSDNQIDSNIFWQLYDKRLNYDFIIGRRVTREDGFFRLLTTKTLQFVLLLIFWTFVKDANCPFRIIKVATVAEILPFIPENYNLTNVALTTIATKQKRKMMYIDVIFKNREHGVNSINMIKIFKIGYKALLDFIKIRISLSKQIF